MSVSNKPQKWSIDSTSAESPYNKNGGTPDDTDDSGK